MAGKHSRKTKSKAPVIIVVVIAVLLIAAAAVFFIFFNPFKDNTQPTAQETTAATEQIVATAVQTVDETVPPTAAPESDIVDETGVPHETSEIEIELPGGEENASYFNASFIPNGKVIDTYSGNQTNLREVFGTAYTEGVVTFNSDGTFTDTLVSSGVDSGKYAVKDGAITATYTDDKNMQIEVLSWDGDTPSEFFINYGGYEVYFG